MNTNQIKCPSCGSEIDVETIIAAELEQKYARDFQRKLLEAEQGHKARQLELEKAQQQFEEKKKRENEIFQNRLAEEKRKMQQSVEESLRKTIHADYENKLQLAEQGMKEQEERLKTARQKEMEYLQKEKMLQQKEEDLELQVQRQLLEGREKLKLQLQKEQSERLSLKEQEHLLRTRELEKQLEDQKKLVDEMKRKAEQGSMQMQGEVQELLLEEMLKTTFPFDEIAEVGKGVRGADCIQMVRNNFGQECGKIIYESKRTKDFSQEWIEKLKTDMRQLGADVAVIVTQAMPKGMDCFGERDGVVICGFQEVRSVALLLRSGILKVSDVRKSGENKGDKMVMLYDYLTGSEFGEQWKAIREGFLNMKLSIQKERDAMEKLWKAREKQLEKVLLNAAHIHGSVEGIAGADTVNLNLLDEGDEGC